MGGASFALNRHLSPRNNSRCPLRPPHDNYYAQSRLPAPGSPPPAATSRLTVVADSTVSRRRCASGGRSLKKAPQGTRLLTPNKRDHGEESDWNNQRLRGSLAYARFEPYLLPLVPRLHLLERV